MHFNFCYKEGGASKNQTLHQRAVNGSRPGQGTSSASGLAWSLLLACLPNWAGQIQRTYSCHRHLLMCNDHVWREFLVLLCR